MRGFELHIQFEDGSKETAEVYVEGKIQGKSCRFLLDTGCSMTVLCFDAFSSHFKVIGSDESSGILGRSDYDLISASGIEFGPIKKDNVILSRAKKGGLDRNLLGMDVLQDYCLHFFFQDRQVLVNPQLPDRKLLAHDLLLDRGSIPYVQFECGKSKVSAVWDTGASVTLVDLGFIEKRPAMFKYVGREKGTDSTGSRMETPIYKMEPILLGGQVFPAHKVVGVDLAHVNMATDIPMNFVLGYSTLSKANWHFDFPRKKWAVLGMIN